MGIYAKTGKTFQPGAAFIFTGNSSGDHWEVDYPISDGIRLHGVTSTFVDEFSFYPAFILDQGPLYVMLSGNVSINDELTIDTNGAFKKRTTSDVLDGIALSSGVSGGACAAIILNLNTTLIYQNQTIKSTAKIWTGQATTTSGVATFNPTDDNTGSGNALFTNIYSVQATALANTASAVAVPVASIKTISSDKKTITVNIIKGTDLVATGATTVFAPDGTVVSMVIVGD